MPLDGEIYLKNLPLHFYFIFIFLFWFCSTKSKYSNFSICLSTKKPFGIVKCPAALLKTPGDCARSLKVVKKNSIPVPATCKAYYPWHRGNDRFQCHLTINYEVKYLFAAAHNIVYQVDYFTLHVVYIFIFPSWRPANCGNRPFFSFFSLLSSTP